MHMINQSSQGVKYKEMKNKYVEEEPIPLSPLPNMEDREEKGSYL